MWKLYLVSERAQYKFCKNGISPKKPYYKLVIVVLVLRQLCLRLASLAQAKNSKRSLRSLIAVQWSQSPTGICGLYRRTHRPHIKMWGQKKATESTDFDYGVVLTRTHHSGQRLIKTLVGCTSSPPTHLPPLILRHSSMATSAGRNLGSGQRYRSCLIVSVVI